MNVVFILKNGGTCYSILIRTYVEIVKESHV